MKALARDARRSHLKHTLVLASYFQLGWLLVALIVALTGQYVSGWWLALILPAFWIPVVLEAATGVNFPSTLQVHFYLFVSAAAVLGDVFGFYDLVLRWDTFAHLDSGVVLAWLGLFMVRTVEHLRAVRLPRWVAIVVAVMVPMAFAAMWEIVEFTSDNLAHTTAQNGLVDTMIDMIAAAVGAAITIIFVRYMTPKNVRPKAFISAKTTGAAT